MEQDEKVPGRVICYGRQSTAGQEHAEASQRRVTKEWAEESGASVEGPFFYDVGSGADPRRRSLAEAIEYVRDHKPNGWRKRDGAWIGVVVSTVDRLSRSLVMADHIEGEFLEHGARVYYANADNGLSADARIQRLTLRFLAEVEAIRCSARSQETKNTLRRAGKSLGNAPLGRRVDSCPEGTPKAERPKVLKVDETEAAVLDLIYVRCSPHGRLAGWKAATSYAVAAELNASPELYPPRGKQWYAPSLHRTLKKLDDAGWPGRGLGIPEPGAYRPGALGGTVATWPRRPLRAFTPSPTPETIGTKPSGRSAPTGTSAPSSPA